MVTKKILERKSRLLKISAFSVGVIPSKRFPQILIAGTSDRGLGTYGCIVGICCKEMGNERES